MRYQTTALPIQTHFYHSLPVITCFLAQLRPLPYFTLRDRPPRFLPPTQTLMHTLAPHTHTKVEPLTFECVFVKFPALCVCLSEKGSDFSDNGLPKLIDSIWGAERQRRKGPGLQLWTPDCLLHKHTHKHTHDKTGVH